MPGRIANPVWVDDEALRHELPRAAGRPATAGQRPAAAGLRGPRAAAQAGPHAAAVGGLPRRGPARRPLRHRHQDPPLAHRRRQRPRHRARHRRRGQGRATPRRPCRGSRAGRRARGARHGGASSTRCAGRPRSSTSCAGGLNDVLNVGLRAAESAGTLLSAVARTAARPAPDSPLNAEVGTARRWVMVATDLDDYRTVRRAWLEAPTPRTSRSTTSCSRRSPAALRAWLLGARRGGQLAHRRAGDGAGQHLRRRPGGDVRQPGHGVRRQPARRRAGCLDAAAPDRLRHAPADGGRPGGRRASLANLAGFAPPTLHALGARLGLGHVASALQRHDHQRAGPAEPALRRRRARCSRPIPVMPLAKGQALSIGITSYDGGVYYGLNADRDAMPDVDDLGSSILESLDELTAGGSPDAGRARSTCRSAATASRSSLRRAASRPGRARRARRMPSRPALRAQCTRSRRRGPRVRRVQRRGRGGRPACARRQRHRRVVAAADADPCVGRAAVTSAGRPASCSSQPLPLSRVRFVPRRRRVDRRDVRRGGRRAALVRRDRARRRALLPRPERHEATGVDGGPRDPLTRSSHYDERGERRGARAPASVMRRENLWHAASSVVVRDPLGRVYLHRRTTTKDVYPGLLDFAAGGVVLAGEDPPLGAVREVEEELGVRGVPLEPPGVVAYADASHPLPRPPLHGVTWDGPIRWQPEEVSWGDWVVVDELVRRLDEEPGDGRPRQRRRVGRRAPRLAGRGRPEAGVGLARPASSRAGGSTAPAPGGSLRDDGPGRRARCRAARARGRPPSLIATAPAAPPTRRGRPTCWSGGVAGAPSLVTLRGWTSPLTSTPAAMPTASARSSPDRP